MCRIGFKIFENLLVWLLRDVELARVADARQGHRCSVEEGQDGRSRAQQALADASAAASG
jgi:hypothetical protein